jgi:hypothetical protein
MKHESNVILLLHATSHAMKAEKILVNAGIECRIVPVPKNISSDCGVCVRIRSGDLPRALESMNAGGLEIEGTHEV